MNLFPQYAFVCFYTSPNSKLNLNRWHRPDCPKTFKIILTQPVNSNIILGQRQGETFGMVSTRGSVLSSIIVYLILPRYCQGGRGVRVGWGTKKTKNCTTTFKSNKRVFQTGKWQYQLTTNHPNSLVDLKHLHKMTTIQYKSLNDNKHFEQILYYYGIPQAPSRNARVDGRVLPKEYSGLPRLQARRSLWTACMSESHMDVASAASLLRKTPATLCPSVLETKLLDFGQNNAAYQNLSS